MRCVPQGRLCDDGLAPKTITTAEFEAVANYSYHLDAGKFAPSCRRIAARSWACVMCSPTCSA